MIDISNDMTDAFYADKDIKKGKVLIFNFEGTETHMKITRLNRTKKTCFVTEVNLVREEDLEGDVLKQIKEQVNG